MDIVSDPLINPAGNLTVVGDLDLSGLRYGGLGPQRSRAARRRTGRAEHPRGRRPDHSRQHQRRLRPPPSTPDDQGWYLFEWRNAQNNGNTPFGGDIVIPIDGVSLDKGTVFPKGAVLNYDLPAEGVTLPKGIALPVAVELAGNYVLPAGWCWARTCTTATARWPGAPARCRRPT